MNKRIVMAITVGLVLLVAGGCNPATVNSGTPLPLPEIPITPTPTPEPTPVLQQDSWIKAYGDNHVSLGGDVLQTSDGGYLIVGSIGERTGDDFQGGVMLLKTDPYGEVVWEKVYGGEEYDAGWSITPCKDGNYLIAGETASFGKGGMDGYLIKVDQDGNEIWSHTFGSSLNEMISSVIPVRDGGYLLVGNSVDPNDVIADPGAAGYAGFAGRSNIYLVKIDQNGEELWSRHYESVDNIIASSGQATPDGGLIILATIIYYPDFDNDIYLLKVDGFGNVIWSRTWGEAALSGYAMSLASNDSLIITGISESGENIPSDIFLLKVDLQGNQIWAVTQGESTLYESGQSVIETSQGNYLVLASSTTSLYIGQSEISLVLFDVNGDMIWMKPIPFRFTIKPQTIHQLADDDYIITGSVIDFFSDIYNAVLVKVDTAGDVQK